MITRQEAENQTDRCFLYHLGAFAGTLAVLAAANRQALPWVAGAWGIGVAVHGAMLYSCPETREMLLRTTASLMEDHRAAIKAPERNLVPSGV